MHRDEKGEALIDSLEKQIRDTGEAGFVILVTRERAHWRVALDAPWTALHYDQDTGQIKLTIRSRDFKTNEQAFEVLGNGNGLLTDELWII